MVCNRCKMVVQAELDKLGLHPISVTLGLVEIQEELSDPELYKIEEALTPFGFELLKDRKRQIVEQIKTTVIELVHYIPQLGKVNLSTYLTEKFAMSYSSLSSTFSEMEQFTIEKYFILQKIERVKELLNYGELTLGEIAYQLHYSSVAHLSAQFKKVSGETPTSYRLAQKNTRKTIDEV